MIDFSFNLLFSRFKVRFGVRSVILRNGSEDPVPYRNETDQKNTALNAWAHLVLTLDYQACNLIDNDLEMVKNTFHTNIILTGKLHN